MKLIPKWCKHIKWSKFYKCMGWSFNGLATELIKYTDNDSFRGEILSRTPWMFCPMCGTKRPKEIKNDSK